MKEMKLRRDFTRSILNSKLSSNARFVGLILLSHIDEETGRCLPLVQDLALETKMSEGSIKRGIKELKESGFVKTTRVKGARHSQNEYHLHSIPEPTITVDEVYRGTYDEQVKWLRELSNEDLTVDGAVSYIEFWPENWSPKTMGARVELNKGKLNPKIIYLDADRNANGYWDFSHYESTGTKRLIKEVVNEAYIEAYGKPKFPELG